MEPSMPPNDVGRIRVELPAGMPFAKKWDIIKPVIKQLYVDENQKLPDLIEFMKQEYGFVALEHDYKYHFKKWKMKKNISTPMKEKILKVREKHSQPGVSTMIKYQGRNVEDKKLRRHLKEGIRRNVVRGPTAPTGGEELRLLSGSAFLVSNSIWPSFLNWNIPYGTMRSSTSRAPNYVAPSPMSVSTPSDIEVAAGPNNALSPNNAPSPISRDQSMKLTIDRAHMLMGGQIRALVNSMRREDKNIMSTWLYQFWLHGFKTAKHWGRGPRKWTAELLGFNAFQATSPVPIPLTPGMDLDASISHPSPSSLLGISSSSNDPIHKPSQLCRWSIHYDYDEIQYKPCKSRTPSPELNPDPSNEETWRPWPSSCEQPTYQETLLNNLAKNEFSNIKAENLPIAVSRILETSENSQNVLLEEAFGFAIMARNSDVVLNLAVEIGNSSEEIRNKIHQLDPLHLATSYLDGSKTCCNILGAISVARLPLRSRTRNNLGHTALDNLMIAILKAHTSINPGKVDESLKDEKRFPGEEVDICGRWDADSECIRDLLKAGDSSIPFAWKHKFCHTSVQIICHCIDDISGHFISTGDESILDLRSGLFTRRCVSCGLKMDLKPLHVLVLVASVLAQFGAKDEDLFGMLAVLLNMLQGGANPLITADVSAAALFSDETHESDPAACNHRHLRPGELAGLVPPILVDSWPDKAKVGWKIFCHILRCSEKELHRNDFSKCSDEEHFNRHSFENRDLAILAGATQAEYLTYRRLAEGDPWVSPNFDMHSILEDLKNGDEVKIGLVEKEMIKPVCDCGEFEGLPYLPVAKQVMRYHFSNLEDWSRTTFIENLRG